ncbi:MotA/TolQ/ExbB proton channel family protein [Budvicia diplopodorum]|uniref:MotA/TolQ/ExbB proton channel family protein n=1 Tax=Budvicia diplopodorum TaxID=1119056 RepID=UPI0013567D27|nr:MotA/TolQ/ExbB proton channel family protein [Budvicia diplopodorum]
MSLKSANQSLRFVFIILTVIVCCYFLFFDDLLVAIDHSPLVNSSIIGVQIIGVIYSFFVAISLVIGIKDWRRFVQKTSSNSSPVRLRGAVGMLQKRVTDLAHSNSEVRNALLQTVRESFSRKVTGTEYLSGLLVGLGLLGTFIGLIMTMGSIKEAIGVMSSGNGEISALLEGLAAPLGGMSAAFTASLLGLLGSLVMGLIAHMLNTTSEHLYSDIDSWVHAQLAESNVQNWGFSSTLADGKPGVSHYAPPSGIGANYEVERLLRGILKFTEVQQAQQHESVNYLNKLLACQEKLFTGQQAITEGQQSTLENIENNHQHLMDIIDVHNQHIVEILQGSLNQQSGLVTAIQTTNSHLAASGALLQRSLNVHENLYQGVKRVNDELSELNLQAGKQSQKQDELIGYAKHTGAAVIQMNQSVIQCTGYLNQNRIQVSDTFEQVAESLQGLRTEMAGGRQQILTLESLLRMGSDGSESIVQAVKSQNHALLECVRQVTEARVSLLSASEMLAAKYRNTQNDGQENGLTEIN